MYRVLYNNQINARVLIGQSAMVYCAWKNRVSSELLYKSNRPQVSVSGSEAEKPLGMLEERWKNYSSVLPSSRVVYRPINHRNLIPWVDQSIITVNLVGGEAL